MKPEPPLKFGELVQLNPDTVRIKAFAGCFMVVTEPKAFGAEGFVQVLGADRYTPGGQAYYRAHWDEMEWVGVAKFVPADDVPDGSID
jgi:hypothetical protein